MVARVLDRAATYPSWLLSVSALMILGLWGAAFARAIADPAYTVPAPLHAVAFGLLAAIHGLGMKGDGHV